MNKILGLAMIARNNPEQLDICLSSCHSLFDEIVLVDTKVHNDERSILSIAEKYNARYFEFPWIDDFGKARNYSFRQVQSPWIMWLDSDDIIKPTELLKLFDLKQKLHASDVSSYIMVYNYGHDHYGNPHCDHFRHRIVKNIPTTKWAYPIHEILVFKELKHEKKDICIEQERGGYMANTREFKTGENRGNQNYTILKKAYLGEYRSDGRIAHYYARELFYRKEYQNVVDTYKKRLYDVPDYTRLGGYFYYAKALFFVGSSELAKRLCLEAINKDHRFAEFYCILGDHYKDIKQWDNALIWYKKAFDIPKKPNDTWEVFMDDNCYNKNLIKGIMASLEKGIKEHPDIYISKSESLIESISGTAPMVRRAPIRNENKVKRNEPCFCGSGLKYKKCHGDSVTTNKSQDGLDIKTKSTPANKSDTLSFDTVFLLPLHDSDSSRKWLPILLESYGKTEARGNCQLLILVNGDNNWVTDVIKIIKGLGYKQSDNVFILPMGRNLGWINSINQAMGYVIKNFGNGAIKNIGFLNSDVTFQANWYSSMRNAIDEKGVGGVGFTNRKYNLCGKHELGWLEFSCVLFKLKALAYVSSVLFDENKKLIHFNTLDTLFGMGYFEDDDLCLRLILNGWKLKALPGLITHHVRGSTPDYVKKISGNYPIFVTKWSNHESPLVQDYLHSQHTFFKEFCPWVINGRMDTNVSKAIY